jgi:guanosine-3',5'-bis(diphosphate) 3'-pyrophosphohydrolase
MLAQPGPRRSQIGAICGNGLTDDKELPPEERKAAQIAHAPTLSPGAKLIKLADKISNLNSLASSPPVEWTPQRRRDYAKWCKEV